MYHDSGKKGFKHGIRHKRLAAGCGGTSVFQRGEDGKPQRVSRIRKRSATPGQARERTKPMTFQGHNNRKSKRLRRIHHGRRTAPIATNRLPLQSRPRNGRVETLRPRHQRIRAISDAEARRKRKNRRRKYN
ncbi:hypothetical protein [Neisseria gonorrhoeae]|uniref:hypothetical protein n=1 Tax=Neisseria gonorrhoeae TaxID=485 RepID=UPI00223F3554|nr:hypothetical protein [Neisseria gonorrhoeae]UYP52478.1 hypothetical protein ND436_002840 [Neisseria gonorrhoeae]